MENSKLIQMVKSLSETEMKELGKFLENQAHRKTGGVITLYKYLKKHHPVFPDKHLKREVIEKKLFKESNNAERRLIDAAHQFVNALEKFLVYQTLEENQVEWDFLLLKALRNRKLDKLFFYKIETIEKSWKKKNIPGIEHLHEEFKLKRMCIFHPNYSLLNDTPLDPPDLLKLIDKYYFAIKLYYSICIQITNQNVVNEKMQQEQILLNEITALNLYEKFDNTHQITFMAKLLETLNSGSFEDFTELKNNFHENIDHYNKTEQLDLLNALSLICFQNYKEGVDGSLTELFDLHRFSVEKNIVIYDNYIEVRLFEVIVNIGCAANELEWTEQFIRQYNVYLQEEERMDMVNLCEANVAICKNDFELALQKLAQMKYPNPYYGLQARSFQLQCYYELDDYEDLFYNLIRSFTTYLHRGQLFPESVKEIYLNFIKYTKQLKKAKEDRYFPINDLFEQINEEGNTAWKKWLLKKTEEQMNKKQER